MYRKPMYRLINPAYAEEEEDDRVGGASQQSLLGEDSCSITQKRHQPLGLLQQVRI